jgi:hypothetical protein
MPPPPPQQGSTTLLGAVVGAARRTPLITKTARRRRAAPHRRSSPAAPRRASRAEPDGCSGGGERVRARARGTGARGWVSCLVVTGLGWVVWLVGWCGAGRMRGWRGGFIGLAVLRVRACGVWLLPGWHEACAAHVEWSETLNHPTLILF